jgi:hypothetical protein
MQRNVGSGTLLTRKRKSFGPNPRFQGGKPAFCTRIACQTPTLHRHPSSEGKLERRLDRAQPSRISCEHEPTDPKAKISNHLIGGFVQVLHWWRAVRGNLPHSPPQIQIPIQRSLILRHCYSINPTYRGYSGAKHLISVRRDCAQTIPSFVTRALGNEGFARMSAASRVWRGTMGLGWLEIWMSSPSVRHGKALAPMTARTRCPLEAGFVPADQRFWCVYASICFMFAVSSIVMGKGWAAYERVCKEIERRDYSIKRAMYQGSIRLYIPCVRSC